MTPAGLRAVQEVETAAETFGRVRETLGLRPQAFADRLNLVLAGSGRAELSWRDIVGWKTPPEWAVTAALSLLEHDPAPAPRLVAVVDLDAVTV